MLFSTENDSSPEEDDDFNEYEASSSKLGSLFAANSANLAGGNSKLIYKAPKHPQVADSGNQKVPVTKKAAEIDKEKSSKPTALFAAPVHAFLLRDGKFAHQGSLGLAVLGNQCKEYKMLLYTGTKQTVCQTTLKFETEFKIDGDPTFAVQFFDDTGQSYWSVNFVDESRMVELLKWYLVSKVTKLGQTWDFDKDRLFVDVCQGEVSDKAVDTNDNVELEYKEFPLREDGLFLLPSVNDSPESIRVKLGRGKISKAWEICIIGMRKSAKRLFVVPNAISDNKVPHPVNQVADIQSSSAEKFQPILVYATVKRIKKFAPNAIALEHSHVIDDKERNDTKDSEKSRVADAVDSSSMKSRDVIQPPIVESELNVPPEPDDDPQRKAKILSKVAKIGYSITALPAVPLQHSSVFPCSIAHKDSAIAVASNREDCAQQPVEVMPDLIMQQNYQQQHELSADKSRNNEQISDSRIEEQRGVSTNTKITDDFFEKLANIEKLVIDQNGAIDKIVSNQDSNNDNKERLEICLGKLNILEKKVSDISKAIENIDNFVNRMESFEKTITNKFDEKSVSIGNNREGDSRLNSFEQRVKDLENLQRSIKSEKSQNFMMEEKSSQIKKIMNSVFKTINASLDMEKTYEGDEIRSLLLKSIKECTLKALSEIESSDNNIDPVASNTFDDENRDTVEETAAKIEENVEKFQNGETTAAEFAVVGDCEISPSENPPPLPEETQ